MPSSDGRLTFEDGIVTLGGEALPGILHDCSVGCEVRFDEAEMDDRSGSTRTPLGWKDGDVSLTLDLPTDDAGTCYRKLRAIDAVFKGYDNGGNPKVYDVVSSHLAARGVRQVVFSGLTSQETDQDDVVQCRLTFREHKPAIVEVENRASARSSARSSAPAVSAAEPAAPKSVSREEAP